MAKKDNSGWVANALAIISIAFIILVVVMMLFGATACAQEPDLEGYSIEAWEANNEQWQSKYDSLAQANEQDCDSLISINDSLENAAQGWYDAFQYVSDTSVKVGDHYFEVHDTITGNYSEITYKGDEVWMTYYVDSLRYTFWVIDRDVDNKHFEFWIGHDHEASQIMRMDTTQFRINYQNLKNYFE